MAVAISIDDYALPDFLGIARDFGERRYGFVVTPNVDHLIRYHEDPGFRAIYADAAYVLLDSRFLSYLLRAVKRIRPQVCTGSDLTAELFAQVIAPTDRLVIIGARAAQVQSLSERHGLRGVRHYDPPMGFIRDPEAVEKVLEFIEANSPFRFCLLAVGAPQQEILAQRLKQRGRARGLALCVGASIDFLTGVQRRAPRWMQRIGAEWLHRLAGNPGRLAWRYLVRGPRVFGLLRATRVELRAPALPAP